MTHGPDSAHVAIGPARARLEALVSGGFTHSEIARALGVNQTSVSNWLHTDSSGHPTMTRLHGQTAHRILQLTAADLRPAAHPTAVDAAPTQRRLDALLAAEHGPRLVRRILNGRHVGAQIDPDLATDVAIAYEHLASRAPVIRDAEVRAEANSAASDARARGGRPPRDWRDIEAGQLRLLTDDPTVNFAAVDAVLAGRWRRLTDAEYLAAIERLRSSGTTWGEVARILRLPETSLRRTIHADLLAGRSLRLADRQAAARGGKGSLAPLAPVVEHLEMLERAGANLTQIARAARVPIPSIRNYLGRGSRRVPELIQASSAQRVLALTIDDLPAFDPRVDAASTQRRLQALATRGWTLAAIARAVGATRAIVTSVATRESVPQSLKTAIADLYARVAFTGVPSYDNTLARGQAIASQRAALEAGWRGPMDWADIEQGILDDELHDTPAPVRLKTSAPAHLSDAARAHVRQLNEDGLSYRDIARQARVSRSSVALYASGAGDTISMTAAVARRLLGVRGELAPAA